MRIIEVKKRRKSLFAIVFEEGTDLSFCTPEKDSLGLPLLDAGLVAEKNLSAETELSNEEFKELVCESCRRRAKSRAMWYLSRGDHSEKELFLKLKRAFPEHAAAFAVEKMKEYGYLNDERYAERLAQSLLCGKKVGVREAQAVMTAKGIDRETARYALEDVECDTVSVIKELVNKKYKNRLTEEKGVQKVIAALARRGFSFSDIREALKSLDCEAEIYED